MSFQDLIAARPLTLSAREAPAVFLSCANLAASGENIQRSEHPKSTARAFSVLYPKVQTKVAMSVGLNSYLVASKLSWLR